MGRQPLAGASWVGSATEMSESPPPVPRSGCMTGPCLNVTEPSALRFLAMRQKFEPSPVGAETYAADLPSAGTRMDGSAPPPARIIGRLNVAWGTVEVGCARAGRATVTPPVSVAATRPARAARRAGMSNSRRRCRESLRRGPASLLPGQERRRFPQGATEAFEKPPLLPG